MREKTCFSLEYVPLLIRLRCLEEARLPDYLGSMLHGIMGWALKGDEEVYRYIYENRRMEEGFDIVNPYVIDPPQWHGVYRRGDILQFQFLLLGDAASYAERVCRSLAAFGIFQLGAGRKNFELVEILHGRELYPLWNKSMQSSRNAAASVLENRTRGGCRNCSIQLLTPLRIRRGGALVEDVSFPTIVRNITRRIDQLTQRYGGFMDREAAQMACKEAEAVVRTSSGLSVMELKRYSNRRKSKTDLSGLLGAMTFCGELDQFTPWLSAARVLHIGRNATFGCGKMDVLFW